MGHVARSYMAAPVKSSVPCGVATADPVGQALRHECKSRYCSS